MGFMLHMGTSQVLTEVDAFKNEGGRGYYSPYRLTIRSIQNTPYPFAFVMIKSNHTTSEKRPIALVSGPVFGEISRYYETENAGCDLTINNE